MSGSRLPPRSLLVLIGAIAIVPLAILLWLRWQLLEQDRALEATRRDEQLSAAADRVTAALGRAVSTSEQRLEAGASEWPPDAVTLTIRGDRLAVEPRRHVAFLPVVPPLPTPLGPALDELDAAEYRSASATAAIDALARLSVSTDRSSDTRAVARFRLARVSFAYARPSAPAAPARPRAHTGPGVIDRPPWRYGMSGSSSMSLYQIRLEGWKALTERLGPAGAMRFMMQYDPGHGDYSNERHALFQGVGLDDLLDSIDRAQGGQHGPLRPTEP
jgi:hypothetical protein